MKSKPMTTIRLALAVALTVQVASIDRLAQAAANAWRPVEKMPTPDWVAEHMHLASAVEATSGRYDLARRPFWRQILADFDDPECYYISVKKSTRVGGTLTNIAACLAASEIDPAPAMVVQPNRDAAIEFRDRLYANMLASPTLAPRVPRETEWNTRHIELGTMRVYLAWAGSAQRLRGRGCRRVLRSEVDVYRTLDKRGGDPMKATEQRVKSYFRWTIYSESSPGGEESYICDLYDESDQRQWHVPCPHCDTFQPLRFFPYKSGPMAARGGIAGLKDEAGNWLEPDAARKTAHYVCERGCRIDNAHKQAMIEGGVWAAKGQRVFRERETGEPRVMGRPKRTGRHRGYHLWLIHNETISFGDLAESYLRHRRDGKLAEFFQNELGLRYAPLTRLPEWRLLGTRNRGRYNRGQVPPEAWFLTAGIDVQASRVYYVVRAWGDQQTSWLIDWGELFRSQEDDGEEAPDEDEQQSSSAGLAAPASDLLQLDDALFDCEFATVGQVANPLGRQHLLVRLGNIDAGHRIADVHEYIRHRDRRRVRAIHGDDKVDPVQMFRYSHIERNQRTGKPYEGGLDLWGIYVNVFRQWLAERMVVPVSEPGAFHLPASVLSDGVDYLRQLTNKVKRIDRDEKTGRRKVIWGVRSPTIGDHYFDAEVYCVAAAFMVVGSRGWDARAWGGRAAGHSERPEREAGFSARDHDEDFSAR